MRNRFTAGLLTVTLGAGLFAFGASGAHASSKGRKNTALGIGALAIYELLKGKTGTGLLAGAGAAYAYKRYRDSRKKERRYGRYSSRYYSSPYRTGRVAGYGYPAGYYGNDYGQYQYGGPYQSGSQYQSGRPCPPDSYRRGSSSYVTDEWGNRHYYNPRYGDGFNRYDGRSYRWQRVRTGYEAYDNSPPGWSHGNKRGWRGHSSPPGHWRKERD